MAADFDRTVVRGIGAMYLAQAANLLIPLATMPYLARVLGPGAFGELAFAQALAAYFVLLTDWGFNLTGPQQLLRAAHSADAQATLWDILSAKLALLALSALLLLLLILATPATERAWQLRWAAWLLCVGNAASLGWVLQAEQRLDLNALATLLGKALTIPLIFVLVRTAADVALAAFLTSLSNLVTAVLTWKLARLPASGTRPRFSLPGAVTQLQRGSEIFASTVAISLYTLGSTVALGFMANAREVAVFSSADKIRGAVQSFITPVNQALFPKANEVVMRTPAELRRFLRRALQLQLLLTGAMSLLLMLGAEPLVRLLFGARFAPAVAVLRILSVVPLLVGVSNVFGIQGLVPLGRSREFSRVLGGVALACGALLVPAAAYRGASGVAWVTVAAECAVTVAMGLAVRRALARHGERHAL